MSVRDRLIGSLVATLAVGGILLAMEGLLRLSVDPAHLPHFGASEEAEARLGWHERSREAGSTNYPGPMDELDPQVGWRLRSNIDVDHWKPNAYRVRIRTNADGLRSAPVTQKTAGVTRIGVFGCSQTFGETVNDDEVFTTLLGRVVPQAQVLNFGVRGYGTDQMLLRYEGVGRRYDLDVVVLAFAFYHMPRNANGFFFYAKPKFQRVGHDELSLSGVPVPPPEWLLAEDIEHLRYPWLNTSFVARWTWERLFRLHQRWHYSERGEAWALTKALVARFVRTVRADGPRVIVLNIDEARPELEGPLAAHVASLGVPFANLGPMLREAQDRGAAVVFPNDNHWTAAGHQLVADEVQRTLCREQLVPCGA